MPLDPDRELAARAALRLSPSGPLVLALSGGGDSTALAVILAGLARAHDRPFHALIVDHRLRSASSTEAALTAERARALGARPHILVWDDPQPGQAAARTARHRLLAEACEGLGTDTLFLAHTANDVIETMLMRASRKDAGWRALAAMGNRAMSPAWPAGRALHIARPLVRTPRAYLRRLLRAEGADWIEDPSNTDPKFERVRIRAMAPAPDSVPGQALLVLNDQALALDAGVRRAASRLVTRAVRLHDWGGITLEPGAFGRAPRGVALRALEACIAAVSGAAELARTSVTRSLLDALLAGRAASGGGALLTSTAILGRDPGASAGRADGAPGAGKLILPPGKAGIFDGRFLVCAGSEALTLCAAGGEKTHAPGVPPVLRGSLVRGEGAGEAFIAGLDTVPGSGAAGALIAERIAHVLFVSN
ncbi:MAG: tRNA lysidine(34) synthetase TilS [Oceanicaulis sp.]|uniref:tRNA lysidine(34) synthetase TilS n=1 Tax=Glycocaulis sp. TaxID=1969725 RepID=UPI0025BD65BD|nr:tRNA lysidine(34) synthetase TilS [Glycocaulis sp.]MCC5982042.1 tRNA lysidine(34) synthetase TilS [Oceanicaulis sp.]MCH8520436.1 tRNA lysidine(34) synthetase TilS [Glycocaulis sp.]